ncbi:MAG: phosphotransferase [Snowella sp.]|nr:phosphotransferase [Snowella sp.]
MQLLRDFPLSFKESKTFLTLVDDSDQDLFPVVYSTLAPRALISLVERNFRVETITNCQFWHRGLSDVYLIETLSKPYILRVSHHHWRTQSEIQFELDLLTFLNNHNLPVSAPLTSKAGELSIEINAPEGKRYAALFPFAPGNVPLGDLNTTQSFLFGQVVARLHQVGQHFTSLSARQPLAPEYLLEESLQVIAPCLPKSCQVGYLTEAITHIREQLKALPMETPYWGICWGDPHSGNVHFTDNNQMTLFDFDQCGYGWRAFDLGKFLQVSLQSGLSRKVRDAFLEGYQSVEPLTAIELSCLQALTQTAYIWSWAICLNTMKLHDYSRLDPFFFSHRLERLKCLRSADWQLF